MHTLVQIEYEKDFFKRNQFQHTNQSFAIKLIEQR